MAYHLHDEGSLFVQVGTYTIRGCLHSNLKNIFHIFFCGKLIPFWGPIIDPGSWF